MSSKLKERKINITYNILITIRKRDFLNSIYNEYCSVTHRTTVYRGIGLTTFTHNLSILKTTITPETATKI